MQEYADIHVSLFNLKDPKVKAFPNLSVQYTTQEVFCLKFCSPIAFAIFKIHFFVRGLICGKITDEIPGGN